MAPLGDFEVVDDRPRQLPHRLSPIRPNSVELFCQAEAEPWLVRPGSMYGEWSAYVADLVQADLDWLVAAVDRGDICGYGAPMTDEAIERCDTCGHDVDFHDRRAESDDCEVCPGGRCTFADVVALMTAWRAHYAADPAVVAIQTGVRGPGLPRPAGRPQAGLLEDVGRV